MTNYLHGTKHQDNMKIQTFYYDDHPSEMQGRTGTRPLAPPPT